jgi:hypothetical protein
MANVLGVGLRGRTLPQPAWIERDMRIGESRGGKISF